MTDDTPAVVLQEYLRLKAGESVVRLRDVAEAEDAVFSGTFISPNGHLLTSYHALESRLLDPDYAEEFDVSFEFDPVWLPPGQSAGPFERRARCERGWRDPEADLAILKIDYCPSAYLPISSYGGPEDRLGTSIRSYGFTKTQLGQASLGEVDGKYLRALPELRRFRMANVVRGEGQSGGPVLDLGSRAILGTVVGFLQREINTGDAATASRDVLVRLGLDVDLAALEGSWRREAAKFLRDKYPQFAFIEEHMPQLPDKYLLGRSDAVHALHLLAQQGQSAITLHGAPGSGKTSVAIELGQKLKNDGAVDEIFWHDFTAYNSRSLQELIRRLGLYLLDHDGVYDIVESYPSAPSQDDDDRAISLIIGRLKRVPHIVVLDNVQFALRDNKSDLLGFLAKLVHAAKVGAGKLILTSWDQLDWTDAPTVKLKGLSTVEVNALLSLHNLQLESNIRNVINQYRHDITSVQLLIRRPEWLRTFAREGRLPHEPQELHQYWLSKYQSHLAVPARRLLLALAVLKDPVDRTALESVAEIDNFLVILNDLRTSPPLVEAGELPDGTYSYYLHHNVQQAMLAISDRQDVTDMHKLAARYFTESASRPLSAARHWWAARDSERAINVLHECHEAIIGAGDVEEMMRLSEVLTPEIARLPDGRLKLNVVLASGFNVRGSYDEADERWQFALEDAPSDHAASMLHSRRADTFRLASDYVRARREYEASIEAAARSASRDVRKQNGRASLGLAKLDRLRADYDDALARYMDARRFFRAEFDEAGLVEAEFGLGEVYRLKRDWGEAEGWYSRSIDRARRLGNLERQAYALWGLGEVDRLSSRPEKALAAHEQGLELCRRVGDTRSEGWALLGIAEVHRADSNRSAAVLAYHEASSRFKQTRGSTEAAHAQLGLAETHRIHGDVELDRYEAVEAAYRNNRLRHCLVLSLLAKGLALRHVGQDAGADSAHNEAETLARACSLNYETELAVAIRAKPNTFVLPLNYP